MHADETARLPRSCEIALFCVINKNHILVQKMFSAPLDRAVWHLPRLDPGVDKRDSRRAADECLGALGLDSIRRPMVDLGAVFAGNRGEGILARLLAVELAEPQVGRLPHDFALFPIGPPKREAPSEADDQGFPIVDALVWAGAQIYFSLPESRGRPKDYEIFGSLGMHLLKDDYINLWFPDASRDLGAAGIELSLDVVDQQPTLKIEGRRALLDEEIFLIRSRLLDLARHAKGRFWITEILDGEETVLDFTDASLLRLLNLGAMS